MTIETPLLADRLEGSIYVLQSNPPNLQMLVAASADGVNVKLIGNVHLNEQTGQITTTFSDAPQLPFTDFKTLLRRRCAGGARHADPVRDLCDDLGLHAVGQPVRRGRLSLQRVRDHGRP